MFARLRVNYIVEQSNRNSQHLILKAHKKLRTGSITESRLLVLRLTSLKVFGKRSSPDFTTDLSRRYRSIRLNRLQIQPYTALFITYFA